MRHVMGRELEDDSFHGITSRGVNGCLLERFLENSRLTFPTHLSFYALTRTTQTLKDIDLDLLYHKYEIPVYAATM